MRIVPVKCDIGEQDDAERGKDDTGIPHSRSRKAEIQRNTNSKRENQQQCRAPSAEIEHIRRIFVRTERSCRGKAESENKQNDLNEFLNHGSARPCSSSAAPARGCSETTRATRR